MAGNACTTLSIYLRVLTVLGLEGDINALAADDRVGRKLQDLALDNPARTQRRAQAKSTAVAPPHPVSRPQTLRC